MATQVLVRWNDGKVGEMDIEDAIVYVKQNLPSLNKGGTIGLEITKLE